MAQPKPSPVLLHEMKPGHSGDFFALLAERSKSETRDGKPYFSCRFRDKHRTVAFMVWADGGWYEDCEHHWQEGQFFKIRAVYQEHKQFGPQIDIHNIRPVTDADKNDGFDPFDFVDSSRFAPDDMFAELQQLVTDHIGDGPLQKLVLTILDRHETSIKSLPATRRNFFPFRGGLLEHTLSVAKSCLRLVEKYRAHYPDLQPPLNKELVIAGAVLHDIGRVLEFTDKTVTVEPTVPGHLLGHLFLGRDLVRDTAAELGDLDSELLLLLEHMIVSHLNLPSWGSPRLPVIPESLILHHADDLDAKMEMYARCLTEDAEEGPFTARDPVLNRQLLKGRNK